MYYALIFLSVVMFGGGFALNDVYRKLRGSNLKISMEASFIGSLAGIVFLLIFNGLNFELTLFTAIMALLAALNSLAFTFCSFRALDSVNLSLFSLFSMLGGMLLPFLQGIVFYDEGITLAKVTAVILIFVALALTVNKSNKNGGLIYCIGIFIFNGMSGVLTKLYNSLPFAKASAAGYSIWLAVFALSISGITWLILHTRGEKCEKPFTLKACAITAASGGINKVANFMLVLALMHVDTSVQYPAVTGGVIIVSTLICFFGDKKPTRRELISVAIAFLGTLALFIIPI